VLAQAKAAVAAGDRAAALALLRQLQEGSSTAMQVTPALAEALVATARDTADAEDQAARQVYAQVQEARREIIRLLHETPFAQEDLAAIRAVLDEEDAALEQMTAQRRDEAVVLGAATARRLGAGWLDEKMIQRRWGPYLVYRYRVGKTQKMKYLGKVARQDQ
jgi:hypothetical protein